MLKHFSIGLILVFGLQQNDSLKSQSFSNYNTSNSDLPENYTWCIAKHPSGAIYVGTDYGLAIFNNDEIAVFNSQNSGLTSNSVRSIFIDADGRVWIGTFTGGLFIFDGLDWTNLNTQNSELPDDFIRVVAKDSSGMYWIGTGNGLVKFDGEQVLQVYDEFNSPLESRNISAITVNAQNVKIIGTINGGLTYIDGEDFTVYVSYNSALPDNTITDFDFDEQQRPIFAMPDGGVAIHQGGNNFTWYSPIVVSSMPTKAIECIQYLGAGSFYAGSMNKGLLIRNSNGSWQSYNTQNSAIASDWIRDLVVDEQGRVWMATAMSGVSVFDPSLPQGFINQTDSYFVNMDQRNRKLSVKSNKPISKIEVYDKLGRKHMLQSMQNSKEGIIDIDKLHGVSYFVVVLYFTDGSSKALRPSVAP
ncbi:MAG: two-component regulator propeller domain-containing protein [Flavobacteriales bacterium]